METNKIYRIIGKCCIQYQLQTENFKHEFTYDALNRPVTQALPDISVQTNTYNKAGLLETLAKDSVL